MIRYLPSRKRFASLFITLLIPVAAAAQRTASSAASAERIFEAIGVREGITVCEIGAGDGRLSIAAGRSVGPSGRVFTSELGDSRVQSLRDNVAKSGLVQITVVAGDIGRTNFPDAGCDAMFLRDVYHHFSDPASMNASISRALKPAGRVAIVDFTPPGDEAACPTERDEDGSHGVKPETVSREMREAGFEPAASDVSGQRWFMVVFAKPTLPPPAR